MYASYRKLFQNSRSALLAAIEVYNKPNFTYRDEVFVVLLMNSWELLLKAILARSKETIFYPKKKGEERRTLSCTTAFNRATARFPKEIAWQPVEKNLLLLLHYRDNAVHYYNEDGISSLLYSLAQTSIVNWRDLANALFQVDVGNDMDWALLPLAFKEPVSPIDFVGLEPSAGRNTKISSFLLQMKDAVESLSSAKHDTSRFFTTYRVKLESVKTVSKADFTAAIGTGAEAGSPLIVERPFDLNDPNWIQQKEILTEFTDVHGIPVTTHVFQALVYANDIKAKPNLYWQDKGNALRKFNREVIAMMRRMSKEEVEAAISKYKLFIKEKSKSR